MADSISLHFTDEKTEEEKRVSDTATAPPTVLGSRAGTSSASLPRKFMHLIVLLRKVLGVRTGVLSDSTSN